MNDGFNYAILLQRRWRIIVTGLLTACLALMISRVLPREYTSTGGMIVENSAPTVPELGMGTGSGAVTPNGAVLTQLDVLRSRGLIASVVHDLDLMHVAAIKPGLRLPAPIAGWAAAVTDFVAAMRGFIDAPGADQPADNPTDQLIEYVQKHLVVQAPENSSVISIRYQAGSSKLASAVVDALMNTYLANDISEKLSRVTGVNQWLVNHTATLQQEADAAEQRVADFVRSHTQPEVQGSSTAAIQLAKDQEQLGLAREVLNHKRAVLDSVLHNGGAGAQDTLESRTIQAYKERETAVMQQLATLGPIDPRRASMANVLDSVRRQIDTEITKITDAMKHGVDIAASSVQALEAAVQHDLDQVQRSSVDATTLSALRHEADAKRQLYIAFGSRTEQMRLAAMQLPTARILYPAAPPPAPSFAMLALGFGFLAGAAGAVVWIILRESLNSKIDTTSKMALATGLPVVGCLPEVKPRLRLLGSSERHSGTVLASLPIVDETLRAIWIKLRTQAIPGEGTTVMVTSSEVGEGKTTVAAELANRIASDGYQVLLIDADLRRHQLAATLGLQPVNTLEAVLNGQETLTRAITVDPETSVHCLLADGSITNPLMVLSSNEFKAVLIESKMLYDFVVLDSPPVLRVTDAMIMAQLCQHVLFIVRSGQLAGHLVGEAIRRFADEDRDKIVTLLTRVRPGDLNAGDYFGGYPRYGETRR